MTTIDITEANTSRYIQAGSIRVHYNEAGTGEPLIFCEGQGPGTSAWVVYHRVIGPLSQHFRCLLLDQPGYGKSDVVVVKGESRSTMYARTVRDFMNALDIEKATIVDMSFGAQTAQVFAVENPERVNKLVLHASGMPGPTLFGHHPSEGLLAMAEAFANPTMETMRKMMHCFLYNGQQYSDEELMLRERLEAWLSRPEQDEARRRSDSIQRDLSADLHKIRVPVLQIHGRNDRVSPLEGALRLLNYLPDSRLVVLNHCGHWVPFEKPQEFCRLVIDFVKNT
ncbi:MAG TPA: alpha/beta hydrolase [Chloroflexota bacterium]|nr:alpha/beta hydrolase [Chloroflexota bacterium]